MRIQVCNNFESSQLSLMFSVADVIQGINPEWNADLGSANRRDPDALPPQNFVQLIMHCIYSGLTALFRGNCLFALKAGLLTGAFQYSRIVDLKFLIVLIVFIPHQLFFAFRALLGALLILHTVNALFGECELLFLFTSRKLSQTLSSCSFIGQLTLARFRGDTTFAFCGRILSTFLGGVVGMVVWFVSHMMI